MKNPILILLMIFTLTACATHPDKIAASSVSTVQYQDYSCRQIGAELSRIERKLNDMYHRLEKTASDDNAQMAVGMILFWPSLFFLEGGDGPEAAEYSRLKGELEALESVAIKKNCGIKFPEPPKARQTEVKTKNNFQQ